MKRVLQASVGVVVEASVISGPDVHYPEEKLLAQLFSIWNNLSIYALSQEVLIQAFSCSPFYIRILKWTKFSTKGPSCQYVIKNSMYP